MNEVRLLDLDLCSFTESQTLYHAVADAMRPGDPNTIIMCRPRRPYVCIGRHQELSREVDLEACRRQGLPVMRREVGGGAVYLDRGQVFFQLVWKPKEVPAHIQDAFEYFARGPVDCYRRLGVTGAHFHPVNDLQVDGRKIGGLGAASIGGAFVFVGSIIMSFNAKAAAGVLKIPDEKMRDKIAQTMDAYVSSLEKELGRSVPAPEVRKELVAAFERALGARLVAGELRADERQAYKKWVGKMRSREWLNEVHLDRAGHKPLRITGHVHLGHGVHKAPGGLVRVTLVVASDEVREALIKEALVSGDFYAIGDAPVEIEQALLGPAHADAIRARLESVWPQLETPGVEAADVAQAAELALGEAHAPVAAGARE